MTNSPEFQPFFAGERPARSAARGPRRRAGAAIAVLFSALVVSACSGKQSSPSEPSESGADAEGPVATGVNATVIVSKCPDSTHIKVRTAQAAIERLVGPCASVPGGKAHFSATLKPGGAIVLASPEGDPAEGVVPTCVLQNRLTHRVPLKSPCTLDVQLDERVIAVDRDAGAPDAEAAPPPAK